MSPTRSRRRARSCSTATPRSPESWGSWPSASSTGAASTRRCARASAAAPSARRPCPSVHPYVLLNYTARRRDVLTLAHELGHGVHFALAARQGDLPPGHASDAGRDRLGVRRDDRVRATARRGLHARLAAGAAGGEHRGHDRDRVSPGRDEPLRGPRPHRAPRGGRAVGRSASASCGPRARTRCSATPWRSPTAIARGGPTSRTSSARPATSTPTPTVSCSRCRCTSATSSAERSSYPSIWSCWPPAGSKSPEELGKIVDVDLADPGFWDAGLDLVERQLREAEAAAQAALGA